MSSPTSTAYAYQGVDATGKMVPCEIERRGVKSDDVKIEILYAGMCHSDISTIKGEWGPVKYPLVVGHEIVGKVTEVGNDVTDHKIGDIVGVGCYVDSCGSCDKCTVHHVEQHCPKATFTYNSTLEDGSVTQGGYSSHIVVKQGFALSIPETLHDNLEAVAPLLCAGVTVFSPFQRAGVKPGDKVGVIGLGGLGHMAIKIASAMGAEVSVFTRSEEKAKEAKKLGAMEAIISKDEEQMKAVAGKFNVILNTVSANIDINAYLSTLAFRGQLHLVGLPNTPYSIPVFDLVFRQLSIHGSLIGSIQETKDMLQLCSKHHVVSEVEVIPMDYVNKAIERMEAADVRYRFVLDVANTMHKAEQR